MTGHHIFIYEWDDTQEQLMQAERTLREKANELREKRLTLSLTEEEKKIAKDIHNYLMENETGRKLLNYTFESCQDVSSSVLWYLFEHYNKHHTPKATVEDFANAWRVR